MKTNSKFLKNYIGKKNHAWKGEKVGYGGLHKWIKSKLGKPNYCEHCKTTKAKKFEWANKSGRYKRDLFDWIRLCTSCHRKMDKTWLRKRNNKGQFIKNK